jgi:magnesium chelatase subunit I
MRGADSVAREIIRAAVAKTFDQYYAGANLKQVVQWFELGGEIQVSDTTPSKEVIRALENIQGLLEKTAALQLADADHPEVQVSAAEFILEGLHAHKRIGRSEERVFTAGEKQPPKPERESPRDDFDDDEFVRRRNRRPFN